MNRLRAVVNLSASAGLAFADLKALASGARAASVVLVPDLGASVALVELHSCRSCPKLGDLAPGDFGTPLAVVLAVVLVDLADFVEKADSLDLGAVGGQLAHAVLRLSSS